MPPAPNRPSFPLLALALVTLTTPAFAASDASPSALTDAWTDASIGLNKDALASFEKQSGPLARYGEAITLLMRQPKTAGNVERAAQLLSELVAAEPDSELGIASRYYLGRIEQTHRMTPAPAAARRHFQDLIKAHPGHPFAQVAVVKLAILDLYEPVSAETLRGRFDALVEQAPRLSDVAARRDLHILLADTAQRFGYEAPLVLDLLLAADKEGIVRRAEQAHVWVRIGMLAADNNRPEIARRYFEKFLANYIRDNRRLMIEERLAALPPAATDSQTTLTEAAR